VWPNQPITDDTVTAWTWAFEDVPYPVAADAAKQWMRGGKPFFPAPSDLRRLTAVNAVAPSLIPEAAWAEVMAQARKVGYGPRSIFHNGESKPLPGPAFSHPLIERAVGSVGWKNICHSDEPTIVRAQFLKTLSAFIEAEVARVQQGETTDAAAIDEATRVLALNGKKS
jgi:hypothetical protein